MVSILSRDRIGLFGVQAIRTTSSGREVCQICFKTSMRAAHSFRRRFLYLMLHSSHTRTSRLRTAVLIACTPQPDHMNFYPVLKPTSQAPANLTQPQPAPPMPCPAPHTPPSHEPANRLGTRRKISKTFGRVRTCRLRVRPAPQPYTAPNQMTLAPGHVATPRPRLVYDTHPSSCLCGA